MSFPTQAHGDRQRVFRSREIVAQHAIQRCQCRFAPGPGASRAKQGIELGEQPIECVAKPTVPLILQYTSPVIPVVRPDFDPPRIPGTLATL
jgi:hypothetical protein